jgi:DNA topoisomerase-3
MTVAVIAEKPSVARDIAEVLGARSRGQGSLSGNGYVVTWAVGHLASLAQPHEIQPRWKRWNLNELPMIPHAWPVRVYDKTRDQFDVVQQILCAPDTERIVCATDAGREGELIFRFIYEAAGADKPVQRLWISSLTNQAIEQGFANLRPGSDFDGLADAARGRSQADWLVGMNLSRFYTTPGRPTPKLRLIRACIAGVRTNLRCRSLSRLRKRAKAIARLVQRAYPPTESRRRRSLRAR